MCNDFCLDKEKEKNLFRYSLQYFGQLHFAQNFDDFNGFRGWNRTEILESSLPMASYRLKKVRWFKILISITLELLYSDQFWKLWLAYLPYTFNDIQLSIPLIDRKHTAIMAWFWTSFDFLMGTTMSISVSQITLKTAIHDMDILSAPNNTPNPGTSMPAW